MAPVQIRVTDPAEYPAVGDLVVEAYRTLGEEQGPEYETEMRDVASRAISSTVLVALLDGSIVGTATFAVAGSELYEVDDPDGATIRMLGVDAAARGRGVGEALVRACVTLARDAGAARVWLHTEPFMAAARRLYERLGFQRQPGYDWTPVPGIVLLAYVLELGDPPAAG